MTGLQTVETCLVDPAEDRAEAGSEGIALLGEERVSGLRSLETELGVRQRHPRWEDVLAGTGSGHGDRKG